MTAILHLQTFRLAGIGGLTGLLLGAAISLVMVAWPGLDAPGGQAIAQLLGPNVGLVAEAALGACAGFFLHRLPTNGTRGRQRLRAQSSWRSRPDAGVWPPDS